MFGIGLAAASGAHLRPRFADNWLPTTWQPALAVLQPLVTAVIFFLFALLAIQLVAESYQLAERSTVLQTPVWPMQCLLPLAFLQAALRYGLYALHPSLQPIVGLVQE
jgi:TRAP-type C4-dicarboxylate transport system permease small subunit